MLAAAFRLPTITTTTTTAIIIIIHADARSKIQLAVRLPFDFFYTEKVLLCVRRVSRCLIRLLQIASFSSFTRRRLLY
jgi:hypothetical protein